MPPPLIAKTKFAHMMVTAMLDNKHAKKSQRCMRKAMFKIRTDTSCGPLFCRVAGDPSR